MNYSEFYQMLQNGKLVSADWRNVLKLFDNSYLQKYDAHDLDDYFKILVLYFSLIDEGNVYMSLDKENLREKFKGRVEGLKIQAQEDDETKDVFYNGVLAEINAVIDISEKIESFDDVIAEDGTEKFFVIKDKKLFTRKHFNAVNSIVSSVKRIFTGNNAKKIETEFDYHDYVKSKFRLSDGQESICKKGIGSNLLITGGPGTGKTTSVFFLLMSLLLNQPDYNIYLTAPSGKAASRMKESVLNCAGLLEKIPNEGVLEKIKGLEEFTIHRLLHFSPRESRFRYNAGNQFDEKSIFVIDEASMIDVNIFASLLEAIPNEARVFILGDKNQLPSVECGAVFGALLGDPELKDNIVELNESKRFGEDTDINKLAKIVNAGNSLAYIQDEWQDWKFFELREDESENTPIYFYSDIGRPEIEMVDSIAKKWYGKFYLEEGSELQKLCVDITPDLFDSIWKIGENARILCANNRGTRGIEHINHVIIKEFYSIAQGISGFFPGELLIITQNNKVLELYNGDCGVTVKFSGDDALYLMLKKSTNLYLDDHYVADHIFQIGEYIFYPISLIESKYISPAFAITIHKSQGSDYNNILVILPKTKGHPLLNRQIVYTAITRTKKNTYILSNQENLQQASDTMLVRDTF